MRLAYDVLQLGRLWRASETGHRNESLQCPAHASASTSLPDSSSSAEKRTFLVHGCARCCMLPKHRERKSLIAQINCLALNVHRKKRTTGVKVASPYSFPAVVYSPDFPKSMRLALKLPSTNRTAQVSPVASAPEPATSCELR
jgi:hypothetical protein